MSDRFAWAPGHLHEADDPQEVVFDEAGQWDPSEHPRGYHGRFGHGTGHGDGGDHHGTGHASGGGSATGGGSSAGGAGKPSTSRGGSRHSGGQSGDGKGLPDVIATGQVKLKGGGTLTVSKRGDERLTLSDGHNETTVRPATLEDIGNYLSQAEDWDAGEDHVIARHERDSDGSLKMVGVAHIAKGDDGKIQLALGHDPNAKTYADQQHVTLTSSDADKFKDVADGLNGASRIDTGNGKMDIYSPDAGKTIGFRTLGTDGKPVEVNFDRGSYIKVNKAIDEIIDDISFGGDEDEEPVRKKTVSTKLGKINVEVLGDWARPGPGNKMTIAPVKGGWNITVTGGHQQAWSDAVDKAAGELIEGRSPGTTNLHESVSLADAAPAAHGGGRRRFRARLIKGDIQGSSGYYPAGMLAKNAHAFPKGLAMYLDHPTVSEAYERPERSVRDLAGRLASDAVYEGDGLYADIEVYPHVAPIIQAMADDIGLSIRASGTVEASTREDIRGPIVTSLTAAESVDFVTAPGAGGRLVQLLESARLTEAKVSDKPWSGFTQADYDLGQWRRACLVAPPEPSENKSDYKLPVREPDGTLNRNGVHAAASRIGQLDTSPEAKKTAARTLVAAYTQLGEDPPGTLLDLAGEPGGKKQDAEEADDGRQKMPAEDAKELPPFIKKKIADRDDENDGDGKPGNLAPPFKKKKAKESAEPSQEADLQEAGTVGAWLESRLHLALTSLADDLYGCGRLTRPERLALSSAIGDGLKAFTDTVEQAAPGLYRRGQYDEPTPDTTNVPAPPAITEGAPMSGSTDTKAPDGGVTQVAESAREKALAAQLTEALSRLDVVTKRLDDADAKTLHLENDRAARAVVAEALASSPLPPVAHTRVAEAVCRNLPVGDGGALDVVRLGEAIKQAIDAEHTYLASFAESAGVGQVRGLGESRREVSESDIDNKLAEVFEGLGLDGSSALVAAHGRA